MPGQSALPRFRASPWWTAALILGIAFAIYWPALRGGLLWDDSAHVTKPGLQSVAGLGRIWSDFQATQQYYPLLHSAFWIEHRLWGDATLGYHLVNVLLHATSACLLVLILSRLKVPGACLAGLIFAAHPVCVESVAWISEQKNTLSLVFYLLAALAYLRFDGERGQPAAGRAYALATLLFVLALLTKTVTATLPAALVVIFWWERGRLSLRRDVIPLIPWFVLAIASGLLTTWVERRVIGAEGAAFDLTLVQRFLLAGRVTWFYLGKLIWPANLIFVYPHWDAKSAAAGWTGCLAAAVLVTGGLWLLRRRSRGPLAAWLFFAGSLFPALGFFNVFPFQYSYVADHFQYLASLGIITAAASGCALLLGRVSAPIRAAGWGLAAALVAALAFLSNAQSRTYANQLSLYTATIERNPECWMAQNNLGVWYEGRGESEKAIALYQEALRLKPDYANAQNNMGSVLLRMPGRRDEAILHLQEALRLKPDLVDAHDSLGNAWSNMPGRLDDAIAQYREALRINPDFAEAHNNLGNALSRMPGRLDEAKAQFEEALRLKPNYAEAHNNLGAALIAQGHAAEAIAQYREALRLTPGYAEIHFNIAMALLSAPGRAIEAADELEVFLKLRPDNEKARRFLNQIRSAQNQLRQ